MTALLIALGGLGVIVGLPTMADRSLAGTAFGAAAGATFGLYLLLGEAVFGDVPARPMAFHSMTGAAVGFVAVDLVSQGRLDLPSGGRQWLLVACVVVFPTVVAIPMLFSALGHLGAGPTAIITTTEPVFTVVFGALFLAEPIRVVQILGGGLILSAAVLAQRGIPTMPPTLRVREP
ncbi:MAG: DMT family transporter [Acidimicrobiales bacterium]